MRDLVVDENSQVTLRCEALGRPKPTFSWYKNSELILPVPGEIDIVSNVLTIARAQVKKHSGMYECAAQNTHGTSITTAQIKVICKLLFFLFLTNNKLKANSQSSSIVLIILFQHLSLHLQSIRFPTQCSRPKMEI